MQPRPSQIAEAGNLFWNRPGQLVARNAKELEIAKTANLCAECAGEGIPVNLKNTQKGGKLVKLFRDWANQCVPIESKVPCQIENRINKQKDERKDGGGRWKLTHVLKIPKFGWYASRERVLVHP